ncbi:MAG: hypothetical protein ACTSQN_18175 [Candidatus Heimdallarchaeota archaeon]
MKKPIAIILFILTSNTIGASLENQQLDSLVMDHNYYFVCEIDEIALKDDFNTLNISIEKHLGRNWQASHAYILYNESNFQENYNFILRYNVTYIFFLNRTGSYFSLSTEYPICPVLIYEEELEDTIKELYQQKQEESIDSEEPQEQFPEQNEDETSRNYIIIVFLLTLVVIVIIIYRYKNP